MILFITAIISTIPIGSQSLSPPETDAKRPPVLCPVSLKPAQMSITAAYRGGKIAFADMACRDKFRAAPDDFAATANMQLVASGQARQVACPVTGEKLHPKRNLTIHGIRVGFCCLGCLGKVADEAQEEIRVFYAFGNNAFRRGFRMGN